MMRSYAFVAMACVCAACVNKGAKLGAVSSPDAERLLHGGEENRTSTAAYRQQGFHSRAEWLSVVLSAQAGPMTVRGWSGLVESAFGSLKLVPGDGVSRESFNKAKKLGYQRAYKVVEAYPWLRDKSMAYVPAEILAGSMNSAEAEAVIVESLQQGKPVSSVWPPIKVGGRYTLTEVEAIKRNVGPILARSSMTNVMLWLQQILTAGPDRMPVYLDSTPERAKIVHAETGEEYGKTGIYLNMHRETIRNLRIKLHGYEPCTVSLKRVEDDNNFHCEMEESVREKGET